MSLAQLPLRTRIHMQLTSQSLNQGKPIAPAFAFGKPDPETHIALSDNRSPHLAWSDAPEGTKSFALLCIDPDVPTVGDDVNQEGRTVSKDLPRTDFVHWVMVDLPASCTELAEGSCGEGVVARGKQDPPGPAGSRQGVNDYTGWFAGDADMGGTYKGYDGPCPPWNDELLHHYAFRVYALDVERLDVDGDFTAADVKAAMAGHVLAEAELVGTYTNNPDL
jgi:Raf kinase inhibitor-like YbhB/YbcL family protein